MEKAVLKVEGMSCGHCVGSVKTALEALPGVSDVAVDLKTGTVAVSYDLSQTPLDRIKSEIQEQGYDVAE